MKKISTIFKRDQITHQVIDEIALGCEWVFNGEGVATRKYDGTAVKIDGDKYLKRRAIKPRGKIPLDFIEEEFDQNTGKRFGWVPVTQEDKWHIEALNAPMPNGTYELIGPKIQGNPEMVGGHILIKHSRADQYQDVPRNFSGIRLWLKYKDIEGIVFHHPDGRMAKIKKRDFGFERI
jgi:hypothetical protein